MGTRAHGLAAADLDGDGSLDLAVALGQDNGIAIWMGRGDGTFAQAAASPVSCRARRPWWRRRISIGTAKRTWR